MDPKGQTHLPDRTPGLLGVTIMLQNKVELDTGSTFSRDSLPCLSKALRESSADQPRRGQGLPALVPEALSFCSFLGCTDLESTNGQPFSASTFLCSKQRAAPALPTCPSCSKKQQERIRNHVGVCPGPNGVLCHHDSY